MFARSEPTSHPETPSAASVALHCPCGVQFGGPRSSASRGDDSSGGFDGSCPACGAVIAFERTGYPQGY